jgi:hypothetical protein
VLIVILLHRIEVLKLEVSKDIRSIDARLICAGAKRFLALSRDTNIPFFDQSTGLI